MGLFLDRHFRIVFKEYLQGRSILSWITPRDITPVILSSLLAV